MQTTRYWGRAARHAVQNSEPLKPQKIVISLGGSVLGLIIQAREGVRGWALTWRVVVATALAYVLISALSFLWNLWHAPARMEEESARQPAGGIYRPDPRRQHISNARQLAKRARQLGFDVLAEPIKIPPMPGIPDDKKAVAIERIQREWTDEQNKKHRQAMAKYGAIQAKAKSTRDAILAELLMPPHSRDPLVNYAYETPNNPQVYWQVADDLEMLATDLEEQIRQESVA